VINKLYATKSKFPDSHVLVFVDLDREGQSRIEDLWNKIVQKGLTQLIKKHEIFFVNPCIEYLFIIAKENNHPKFCTNKQYKDEKERIYGTDFDAKIIELLQEDKFETLNHNLCRVQKAADDYPSTNIEDLVTYLKRKRP
ncbi:MAG: hypothetical protein GX661_03420, partial [Acholeplasmataceae bacterium]|nr:hypothetical protein [Acholeplasmataceae bacterium]